MVILPFEEYHSIEGQRLRTCTAGFAFQDPDTEEIRTVPVCSWSLFRDDVERKISEKYGIASAKEQPLPVR